MNFAYKRSMGPVFVYYSAVALMIVNGQSTTDDDIGRDKIAELGDQVTMLRRQLATAADEIANLKSELSALSAKKPTDASKSRAPYWL